MRTCRVASDSASSAMTFSSIFSNAVSALLVFSPWIMSLIWRDAAADLARAFSVSFFDLASVSFCSNILVTRTPGLVCMLDRRCIGPKSRGQAHSGKRQLVGVCAHRVLPISVSVAFFCCSSWDFICWALSCSRQPGMQLTRLVSQCPGRGSDVILCEDDCCDRGIASTYLIGFAPPEGFPGQILLALAERQLGPSVPFILARNAGSSSVKVPMCTGCRRK